MSTNEYFQLSIPKDITVEVPLNFDSEKPGFTTLSEEQIVEVINYNLKSILLTFINSIISKGIISIFFPLNSSLKTNFYVLRSGLVGVSGST